MTATALAVGATIGGYRLISPLGDGGMGTVWLAEHTVLGRTVAVKLLRPALSQEPEMVERFFDEARASTRIADPGIVTIHDFGWHHDGQAYLVMEYLVGETLADRLEARGRLEIGEAIRLTRFAALAMSAAHAAGIVHRDLKPDNLFIVADPGVTGGERVKVLDFGIAKLLGEGAPALARTQTGAILGTPLYMSPEQCRSAGKVDQRADVYSLGCVCFHLLTGAPPFPGATTADVIASHLLAAPPSPCQVAPDLDPAVGAVVERCLAKLPDERFGSMSALISALDELAKALDDRGPSTKRPSAPPAVSAPADLGLSSTLSASAVEAPVRPLRGRRGWIAVGGIAVAVMAVGFAVASAVRGASPAAGPGPAPSTMPQASATATDAGLDAGGVSTGADGSSDRSSDAGADATSEATSDAGAPATPHRRPPRYDPYARR